MGSSEQGVQKDRYKVIPRVLIFIFKDKDVLLLKGAPTKKIWANKYNGIGGHVEKGEDALNAARRELSEETGLGIEDLKLTGTVLIDPGGETGITLYVYYGDYKGGELKPSIEGSLEWINSADIGRYPVVEDLITLVPLVRNSFLDGKCFSGMYRYDKNDQLVISIFH